MNWKVFVSPSDDLQRPFANQEQLLAREPLAVFLSHQDVIAICGSQFAVQPLKTFKTPLAPTMLTTKGYYYVETESKVVAISVVAISAI
jgi:hypothetical protein